MQYILFLLSSFIDFVEVNLFVWMLVKLKTVNSEILARILFLRIALKDIFATLKNLQLGHDLPASVNDSVILPLREVFFLISQKFASRCEVSQK